MAYNWHYEELKTIEENLKTDLTEGLTSREARARLEKEVKDNNGVRSSLFVGRKKSALECLSYFAVSPSVILLLMISLLAAIFGRVILGSCVLAVTLAFTVFGGIINLRAQRRLEAMREYASPMVKVKRGGNIFKTDGRNIVSGDVIILSVGDILPCDARLITSRGLVVEEIIRSDKTIKRRRTEKDHLATYGKGDGTVAPDAINCVYAGSAVCAGSAIAVATDTASKTYLSEFLPEGSLSAKDGESEAISTVKPAYYKIVFICMSSLLVLSLLSLLTLQKEEFLSVFLMLLSSVVLVTSELLSTVTLHIFSSRIKKLAFINKTSKTDSYAAIRNIKTLDALTDITDLIIVGKAGLSDGVNHIFSAYTARGVMKELSPEDVCGKRLLNCMFTYVKAMRDGGIENYFSENGYEDSLFGQIKNSGFDINGASLAIKSLYYTQSRESDLGFACAETTHESYRVAMVFNADIIGRCHLVRDGDKLREKTDADIAGVESYTNTAMSQGLECICIISEYNGTTIFEGIVALSEYAPAELQSIMDELDGLQVKRTVFLTEENEENINIVKSFALAPIFDGEIAYASKFRKDKKSITDEIGRYCAYIGFEDKEYCKLVAQMRKLGAKVACYGIDNAYNEIMACSDLAISCDTIRYSTEKYRESVYEKVYPEGRDTNIRCSQQTRLLSRLIVHRSNEKGGGLYAISKAIRASRASYVILAQSMLLFAFLMCSMLTFTAMSVIGGNMLLNPLQTVVLSAVFAFLSATVFTESEHNNAILTEKRSYTHYPVDIIKENISGIIARALVGLIIAVALKILDVLEVFGENSTFTLPIYICLSLTAFAEVFIINRAYTKKGDSRRYCWLKVTVAYALLISVVGLTTYSVFNGEFYPYGIGMKEFFAVAGYIVIYMLALFVAHLINKNKKKA